MKKFLLGLAAFAATLSVNAEVAEHLYIIGNIGNVWAANEGVELTKVSEGVFTIDVTADYEKSFNFADQLAETAEDWETLNAHRYTPADEVDSKNVEPGNSYPMKYGESGAYWKINPGRYTINVDTNTMTMTITGEADPIEDVLYVIGTIGEKSQWWNINHTDYTLPKIADGVYENTFTINADSMMFRFYSALGYWESNSIGSQWEDYPIDITLSEAEPVFSGACVDYGKGSWNIPVWISGNAIKMHVDLNDYTVEFTYINATDIESINTDTADAEYFNMQGMRVSDPSNGLYIMRKGDVTKKVVIR